MDQLHLITVRESATQHLQATGVDILLTISGQSFFTGNEVFKKAIEVANCIAALKACGVAEDQIFLQNVSVAVHSGIISKSTSAKYHLAVKLPNLDSLGSVLTVVASQKNIETTTLRWQYHNLETIKNELLQTAVKGARLTAESIAVSLNTHVIAVHRLSYQFGDLHDRDMLSQPSSRRRGELMEFQSGMIELPFNHSSDLSVGVTAEFVIGDSIDSE